MEAKRRRPQPRLDRVNALKNIRYIPPPSTLPSSSSSLLDSRFFHQSIHVEGINDDEFDHICRALGLSGPEDFAIPTADWESRKSRDLAPSSRLHSLFDSDHYTSDDSSISGSNIPKMSGRLAKRTIVEGLSSNSRDGTSSNLVGDFHDEDRATVCRISFPKLEKQELALKEDTCSAGNKARGSQGRDSGLKSESGECDRDSGGEAGGQGRSIKCLRPQILTPLPLIFHHIVDSVSSTWDISRSFGPQDSVQQENEMMISECCSSTASKDEYIKDRDNVGSSFDSGMNVESVYIISPNGKFRRQITSWQKGQLLGSGSFGTVYEGFTDNGFFFAVKEVSLLDQGSQGRQSILQLEQEISLLSQFEHENIVRYLGTDKVVNLKNGSYGMAADIWSLGCTVLEMLTGQPPYCNLEGMQALFRIGRGEPPPVPSSLSTDARDFIQRCLQVNPSSRPTAAQLLDHPFVKKPFTSISGSFASTYLGCTSL